MANLIVEKTIEPALRNRDEANQVVSFLLMPTAGTALLTL